MHRERWAVAQSLILSMFALVVVSCSSIWISSPSRVVIEWTTASEVNTAGFNIYRAESKDGSFAKVNEQLIPASVDAVAGGKYKYEDADVAAGHTYYYQLEDVEYSGTTTRHGPIVATASGDFGIEWLGPALLGIGMFVVVGAILLFTRAGAK